MQGPQDIELEGTTGTDDALAFFDLCPSVGLSPSLTTPAAAPVQPKDADKALVNVALGTLRLNGWYCQEDESYRSFTLSVKIRTPKRGVIATDNFTVFAEAGVLYFQQLALELPSAALTQLPILETLNEINQRSVSAVFILCDKGVIIRHAMIPRSREEGHFSVAMMVQTMRQMYYDRRAGLSLLRNVIESCGTLDPLVISRTFASPMAPHATSAANLSETENLANFAGFFTINSGTQVHLAREKMPPECCPIRVSCAGGYMRGETVIGETRNGKYSWKNVPSKLRNYFKGGSTPQSRPNEVYDRLNMLNMRPSAVRYVAILKSLVAMGTAFPTDHDITVEQFKVLAEALLEHAAESEALPVQMTRRAG